jgi:Tol biopolymer transport system component
MRLLLLLMSAMLIESACAPPSTDQGAAVLYVFRSDPPTFLKLGQTWQPVGEIPFALPDGCNLVTVHAAPRGSRLALELGCAFGPAVLYLDVKDGTVTQPVTDSDSHFLAWATDGQSMYLRADSINRPRIVRIDVDGDAAQVPISEFTYDLAPAPSGGEFLFAYSQGMGLGSALGLAQVNGKVMSQLSTDPLNYLALVRWSPDGEDLAFIRIPDSATPFTQGELWTMKADGSQARRLAQADAGHGFAPAWSPDGTTIAFVARENPDDRSADVSSDALVSNIRLVNLTDGSVESVTHLRQSRVEAPVWKPNAAIIVFDARVDDRMAVYVANMSDGSLQPIPIESICCAAWLRE